MSRGQVVRKLAGKSSTSEVAVALNELPLNRLRPFRLVAIIPTEKSLTEWRWDLDRLTTRKHAWKSRHWFSSGFDEPRAERERDRVCKSRPEAKIRRTAQLAAAPASLALAGARAVLDLYAPLRRGHGQLHGGRCFWAARDDALQVWTVLFKQGDGDQNDFAR